MPVSPETKRKLRRWEINIGVTLNPFRWAITKYYGNGEHYLSLWVLFGPLNFDAYYDRRLDDF